MFEKHDQNLIYYETKKWANQMEPDDKHIFYEDSIKTLMKKLAYPTTYPTTGATTTKTVKPTHPAPTLDDLLKQLGEIKDRLFIITRDVDLEKKYPELKEAYDHYVEMKRYAEIAEKLANTGKNDV